LKRLEIRAAAVSVIYSATQLLCTVIADSTEKAVSEMQHSEAKCSLRKVMNYQAYSVFDGTFWYIKIVINVAGAL
jgi:hypothetical protein